MKSLKKLFSFKGLFAIFALAISFQIISPEIAFAEQNDTLQGLAELLGVLISVLTFISLLMMNFFGQLLGTNLLTGPEAMQALTPMWVWVRNLTNILFVLVLVGLAFSNLFASFSGEGGGNWTIKEKLPKVIIALVAINFSLLGFKVVIDAVNVGTVAILGIADSRLDADNPEQENAMISDKTWTIVSEGLYGKMKISEFKGDKDKISGGSSCTSENKEANLEPGQVLGIIKPDSKNKDRHYICRSFRSQVNDLFCSDWEKITKNDKKYPEQGALGDDCLFLLKKDTFNTILSPKDEPGQNLFMSFGTTFMHLERLPALGAQINSLNGVIMNTLFSSILGIAYIVALIAIFIALIARVIVIWIALVFSPLLIAASIMGFGDGKAGEATEKLITHLIMPLKIAAAFAVSFVMMSGMVEFNTVGKNDAFLFGPALSNLGIAEYGFMWQMATIVIFWMAAQWATEGNLAHSITEKIFTGAQALGETAARAATIDRQIFSVGTSESGKGFSLSSVLTAPAKMMDEVNRQQKLKSYEAFSGMFPGFSQNEVAKSLKSTVFTTGKEFVDKLHEFKNYDTAKEYKSAILDALKDSKIADKEGAMTALKEGGVAGLEKYLIKNQNKESWKGINAKDGFLTTDSSYTGTGSSPTGKNDDDKKETKTSEDHYKDNARGELSLSTSADTSITFAKIAAATTKNKITDTSDYTYNYKDLVKYATSHHGSDLNAAFSHIKESTNFKFDFDEIEVNGENKILSGGKEDARFMKIIDEKNHFVKFAGSDEGKITKSNVANTFNTAYNNVFDTTGGVVKQKQNVDSAAIKELSILQKSISNIETTLGDLKNDTGATDAIKKVKSATITIPSSTTSTN